MGKEWQQILEPLGISSLTEIQEEVGKHFENFDEVVMYAPTGKGKTLAFLLPIVSLMSKENQNKGIQTLILSPTRELALQIESVFKSLKTAFSVTTCYGGHSLNVEKNNLSAKPDVVIATPGRLVDHLKREYLSLLELSYFVVDEFDKCLEMGFQEDIADIYGETRNLEKLFFCSATKLKEFPVFMKLKHPIFIDKTEEIEAPEIVFYGIQTRGDKHQTLSDLAAQFQHERAIIFCNFREDVDELAKYLKKQNIVAAAYHGGLEQDQRERALIKFRNNTAPILVCTDIGSRGLDIPEVKHIVHFALPDKEDAFVHRNGRTARMMADGSAYIFKEDVKKSKFPLPKLADFQWDLALRYQAPIWHTLYFSAGKKDKINKIDLLGFLCQKGGLAKDEVGVIAIRDFASYASVSSKNVQALLNELKNYKVKGKKLKMELAY